MKGQESSLADALHSGTFIYATILFSKPELSSPLASCLQSQGPEVFFFGILQGLPNANNQIGPF